MSEVINLTSNPGGGKKWLGVMEKSGPGATRCPGPLPARSLRLLLAVLPEVCLVIIELTAILADRVLFITGNLKFLKCGL